MKAGIFYKHAGETRIVRRRYPVDNTVNIFGDFQFLEATMRRGRPGEWIGLRLVGTKKGKEIECLISRRDFEICLMNLFLVGGKIK